MRTEEQKIECVRKVILNAHEHIRSGDPAKIYSQYIRYALDEFRHLNSYTSREARKPTHTGVINEHVVPHSIVMKKLLSLAPLTNETIMSVVQKYLVICVITEEEDKRLSAAGLRSKMPKGWDENNGDVFSRYQAVGISIYETGDSAP